LAQIGGIAVNELQIYSPEPEACKNNSEDFSGNVYGHGHIKIYEQIVAFFNNISEFSVNFEDVFSTIQLLNSFYIANEQGKWINVSSAGDSSSLSKIDNKLADLYRTKFN
jgi:UDP-N-acetyl-2-amino-2-deoxyglucuronate dehydrogenase